MCEQTEVRYCENDVVWVKLGSCWWPGQIREVEKLPEEILAGLKKKPITAVKFFKEDKFEYVRNLNQICLYNCRKKDEFIRKGLDMYRNKRREGFMEKFPNDVSTAEELTGGNPNIIDTFTPEERPNYANIFGTDEKRSKVKSSPRKEYLKHTPTISPTKRNFGRPTFSGSSSLSPRPITSSRFVRAEDDEEVRIRHQPVTPNEDSPNASPYKCQICDFTSSRVNVIVLHNKFHSREVLSNEKSGGKKGGQGRGRSVGVKTGSTSGGKPPAKSTGDRPKSGKTVGATTPETPKGTDDQAQKIPAKRKIFLDEESNSPEVSSSPEKKVSKPAAATTERKMKSPIFGKRKAGKSSNEKLAKKKKSDEEIRNKLLADWDEDEELEEKEKELIKQELNKSDPMAEDAGINMSKATEVKQTSCFDFDDSVDALLDSKLEERAKKFVENRKIPRISAVVDEKTEAKRPCLDESAIALQVERTHKTVPKKPPVVQEMSDNVSNSDPLLKDLDVAFKVLLEETAVPQLPQVPSVNALEKSHSSSTLPDVVLDSNNREIQIDSYNKDVDEDIAVDNNCETAIDTNPESPINTNQDTIIDQNKGTVIDVNKSINTAIGNKEIAIDLNREIIEKKKEIAIEENTEIPLVKGIEIVLEDKHISWEKGNNIALDINKEETPECHRDFNIGNNKELTIGSKEEVAFESREEVAFESRGEAAFESREEVAFESSEEVSFESREEVTFESKEEVAFENKEEFAIVSQEEVTIGNEEVALESKEVALESKEEVFESKEEVALKSNEETALEESNKDTLEESNKNTLEENNKDTLEESNKDTLEESNKDTLEESNEEVTFESNEEVVFEGKEEVAFEGKGEVAFEGKEDVALESKEEGAFESKEEFAFEEKEDVAFEEKEDVTFEEKEDVAVEEREDVALERIEAFAFERREDVAFESKEDVAFESKEDVAFESKEEGAFERKEDVAFESKEEVIFESKKTFSFGSKGEFSFEPKEDFALKGKVESTTESKEEDTVENNVVVTIGNNKEVNIENNREIVIDNYEEIESNEETAVGGDREGANDKDNEGLDSNNRKLTGDDRTSEIGGNNYIAVDGNDQDIALENNEKCVNSNNKIVMFDSSIQNVIEGNKVVPLGSKSKRVFKNNKRENKISVPVAHSNISNIDASIKKDISDMTLINNESLKIVEAKASIDISGTDGSKMSSGDHDYSARDNAASLCAKTLHEETLILSAPDATNMALLDNDILDINSMPVVMTDAIITEEPSDMQVTAIQMPMLDLIPRTSGTTTIFMTEASKVTTPSIKPTPVSIAEIIKASAKVSASSSNTKGKIVISSQSPGSSTKMVKMQPSSSPTLSKLKGSTPSTVVAQKAPGGKYVIVQASSSGQPMRIIAKTPQQNISVKTASMAAQQQQLGSKKMFILTEGGSSKLVTALGPQQRLITGGKVGPQRLMTSTGQILTQVSPRSIVTKGSKLTQLGQQQMRVQSFPKLTMQSTQAKVLLPSMQSATKGSQAPPMRVIGTLKPQSNTILIQTTQGGSLFKPTSLSQLQPNMTLTQGISGLTTPRTSPGSSPVTRISLSTTGGRTIVQSAASQAKLASVRPTLQPRLVVQKGQSPLSVHSSNAGIATIIPQTKRPTGVFPKSHSMQNVRPQLQKISSTSAKLPSQPARKIIASPISQKNMQAQFIPRMTATQPKAANIVLQAPKPSISLQQSLQPNPLEILNTQTLQCLQPVQPEVTLAPTMQPSFHAGKSNLVHTMTSNLPSMQTLQPQHLAQVVASTDHVGDGATTTYVLVTYDDTGALQPYDNSGLLNLEGQGEAATRTLYIDPSSLGSSTDLDNIILTINNSGGASGVLNLGQAVPTTTSQPMLVGSSHDILAAALANTEVFQTDVIPQDTLTVVNSSQSVMTSRLLDSATPTGVLPTPAPVSTIILPSLSTVIPPSNTAGVLETSLTLNQPIMTPLEVPSSVPRTMSSFPPVPTSLELPLTITEPSLMAMPTSSYATLRLPESSMALTLNKPTTFQPSMPLLSEDISDSQIAVEAPINISTCPNSQEQVFQESLTPYEQSHPDRNKDGMVDKPILASYVPENLSTLDGQNQTFYQIPVSMPSTSKVLANASSPSYGNDDEEKCVAPTADSTHEETTIATSLSSYNVPTMNLSDRLVSPDPTPNIADLPFTESQAATPMLQHPGPDDTKQPSDPPSREQSPETSATAHISVGDTTNSDMFSAYSQVEKEMAAFHEESDSTCTEAAHQEYLDTGAEPEMVPSDQEQQSSPTPKHIHPKIVYKSFLERPDPPPASQSMPLLLDEPGMSENSVDCLVINTGEEEGKDSSSQPPSPSPDIAGASSTRNVEQTER